MESEDVFIADDDADPFRASIPEKQQAMTLAQGLGAYVRHISTHGASPAARDLAKLGFVDTIATMLAGRAQTACVTLLQASQPLPPGSCTEIVEHGSTTDDCAALLNGVAAHALDFDDVSLRGHPSAVMVPALLAMGQARGSSGVQLLNAYVAGHAVWADLVDRESGMHPMKGWHPTGIFGAVGAAAACAALLGLNTQACAHAIGLGATQSAGLIANFGSMAKPLQAGRAAQAGVWAARWAAQGFTAGADVLEHSQGFLAAVSPAGDVDRLRRPPLTDAPESIIEQRMSVKKYPTCYYTHRALDGLLDLLRKRPIAADDVVRIEVSMSKEHATVLRNHRPANGLEAKFSIEYAMACALFYGKAGLFELDDAHVQAPRVQQFFERVHVLANEDYDPHWNGAARADQVVLTLRDGSRAHAQPVHRASGHAQRPLDQEALREKFLDCAAYGGARIDGAALFERLWSLEEHGANSVFPH
jgi:2-methylcitrate dehydratase PrpD